MAIELCVAEATETEPVAELTWRDTQTGDIWDADPAEVLAAFNAKDRAIAALRGEVVSVLMVSHLTGRWPNRFTAQGWHTPEDVADALIAKAEAGE